MACSVPFCGFQVYQKPNLIHVTSGWYDHCDGSSSRPCRRPTASTTSEDSGLLMCHASVLDDVWGSIGHPSQATPALPSAVRHRGVLWPFGVPSRILRDPRNSDRSSAPNSRPFAGRSEMSPLVEIFSPMPSNSCASCLQAAHMGSNPGSKSIASASFHATGLSQVSRLSGILIA